MSRSRAALHAGQQSMWAGAALCHSGKDSIAHYPALIGRLRRLQTVASLHHWCCGALHPLPLSCRRFSSGAIRTTPTSTAPSPSKERQRHTLSQPSSPPSSSSSSAVTSASSLSQPVPLATNTADRYNGSPHLPRSLHPQPDHRPPSGALSSSTHPSSSAPVVVSSSSPTALSSSSDSSPPKPVPVGRFFTADWAQKLRWRLFNARTRWRARYTANKVRLMTQQIPFRFPSSPSSSSLLSIPDVLRQIFTPSLISRISDLPFSSQLLIRWRRILYSLLPLGGSSSGNRILLYSDGDDAFQSMWDAISSATRSIRMETYILEPDVIGVKTMELLGDAAERGVDVTLIYDSVGSSALLTNWTHIARLAERGAKVVQFNPILSWPWRRRLLFRNHRKVLVVDERVGFTGGMNIGAEYCGKRLGGNGHFRDTHLRVEGPAVFDLLSVFEDSYTEALPNEQVPVYRGKEGYKRVRQERLAKLEGTIHTKAKEMVRRMTRSKSLPPLHEPTLPTHRPTPSSSLTSAPSTPSTSSSSVSSFWPSPPVDDPSLFVQVLKSNIWRSSRLIQRAMIITLQSARHRAYITTPYFIPPTRLRNSLLIAADKGVDVRLLTSGSGSDVPWSRWAAQHIYHLLLARGVRVYELQGRVLHAKTVCIDGVYATVGSFNFDRMSVLNLEVNLTILDPAIAEQVEGQFFMDLLTSKEVKLEEMKQRTSPERLLHWVCYRLALLIA